MAQPKQVNVGRGPRPMGKGSKIENPGKVFARLMKYIMKNYGIHYALVAVFIVGSVLANVQGTLFLQTLDR